MIGLSGPVQGCDWVVLCPLFGVTCPKYFISVPKGSYEVFLEKSLFNELGYMLYV